MTDQQTTSFPTELAVADPSRHAIPVVIATGDNRCVGFYHPSAIANAGSAVLICSPWGWDEVASYRPRRRLAEHLARKGHPTLRFDLPGTGDSAGISTDAGALNAWLGAIGACVDWLRSHGAERVAVVGLGLGGLLAREAVQLGAAIDDLVVWGAPAGGRAFVREIQAFARLQTSRGDDAGDLPEGWREAGGYVLDAETLEELTALSHEGLANPTLTRALLMGRDGVGADETLAADLRATGVEVTLDPGTGWSGVINHPEVSEMPASAATRIVAWLDGGPEGQVDASMATITEPAVLPLPEGVVESPFVVHEDFGDLYGVIAMPAEPRGDGLCAVLLNAGAIQHTGPNRLWVEAARRWAALGVPALRLDLEGIGEADGVEWRKHKTGDFYARKFTDQVVAAFEVLEASGIGDRFICVGLCTGAYWSVQAALIDDRVKTAVMLNGGALSWHEELAENRAVHRFNRVFSYDWWRRLLLGGIKRPTAREFGAVLRARMRGLLRAVRHRGKGDGPIIADLDLLEARGVRLVLAFSGGEALAGELAQEGIWERLGEWPNVVQATLPGNDHTLRSLPAQRGAAALIDAELRRAAEAAASQSP